MASRGTSQAMARACGASSLQGGAAQWGEQRRRKLAGRWQAAQRWWPREQQPGKHAGQRRREPSDKTMIMKQKHSNKFIVK